MIDLYLHGTFLSSATRGRCSRMARGDVSSDEAISVAFQI